MILIQLGSMPPELVRKSTQLFAGEVMPYLRDLWSEWEDKWSPRGLPENERAMPVPLDFNGGDSNGMPAITTADEPAQPNRPNAMTGRSDPAVGEPCTPACF
jgi:hypothetical protein